MWNLRSVSIPRKIHAATAAILLVLPCAINGHSQEPSEAEVIQHIDAVIKARFEAVLAYTVTEHYAVFRNDDLTHPSAEMTVRTTYNKDTGKTYAILSSSGSALIKHYVFDTLLDNEKRINEPANREASWLTSTNYEMKLKPGGTVLVDGRDCYAMAISPKQKAPNLIEGTMWVDAKDFSTVKIEGVSTKSPSMITGPSHVSRQYALFDGFAQATHAHAETDSNLVGKTVVTIDYEGYEIQIRATK